MVQTIRNQIAQILIVDGKHRYSRFADVFLIALISLNVLAIILESIASFEAHYRAPLQFFEVFSVVIFSLEYLARLWSCVEIDQRTNDSALTVRLRYMLSPMAIIDLAAILPFYLMFLFPVDLRFLRVLRLLRVFKLTRYSGAMNLVLSVFKEEANAFLASLFVLMTLLILASSGIYLLEHELQPEAFGSIPAAMWWAMASLTTVGYGDVVPITPMGKLFGGCITVIGMGMVALPAGILASGFSDQVHRRRSVYEELLDDVMKDGLVTPSEKAKLRQLREKLGLTDDQVKTMTHDYLRQYENSLRRCPHCREPLVLERAYDDSSDRAGDSPN